MAKITKRSNDLNAKIFVIQRYKIIVKIKYINPKIINGISFLFKWYVLFSLIKVIKILREIDSVMIVVINKPIYIVFYGQCYLKALI